ncbi:MULTISPECIES: response regulator transcription factor [unclassified Duganella]|uniref:response regulator n=1 Tax=unclassified Duganella TaxID=2636909 RepID=UPI0008882E5B|nr:MULTISPECIES: response regulator transcription factor [unclassified Duganella]SDG53219.1 two component transcriptional regulator, LuxR family [Duganella sp. OV458]SDJ76030.1 two component transcriptional regulator, LuxR family [Duganella sp. OV510]
MDPISILIADDHPLILAGLSSLLGAMPEFRLVAQATDGVQAVALYRQHRPDVVIMDLSMPRLNGVEAIEQIRAEDASASIVILTTYQGDEDVYRGLQAGAKAYLLKDGASEQLLDCLRTVAAGEQYLPAAVASKLAERKAGSQLSRRELDILAHLATGKSNKMIARSADIEVGTVKFHVNNILAKLNVASRTEAATVAARRGLLSVF